MKNSSPRNLCLEQARRDWVKQEMEGMDLGDRRLDKRAARLLHDLADRPHGSIPTACGGWTETAAAYRFFDNEAVSVEAILQPHYQSTLRRMAQEGTVLLVQDTTEIDLTRPTREVSGAGMLDGSARRGLLWHSCMAFSVEGVALGGVWHKQWSRAQRSGTSKGQHKHKAIEAKESYRWVEGLAQAQAVAEQLDQTQCISVADSEADIYELLLKAAELQEQAGPKAHLVVRACQPRAVLPTEGSGAASMEQMQQALEKQAVLYEEHLEVRGRSSKIPSERRARRQARQPREAKVAVRAGRLRLRAPQRRGASLPALSMQAVLVSEVDVPKGEVPVQWLLLTTLPIEDAEQVRKIVGYYRMRFRIEEFFRVLKSGCRVEERGFQDTQRFLPCLGLYLIVAWRVLRLSHLARQKPQMSCESEFEPAEWQAVWSVTKRSAPPSQPPPLDVMVRLTAQLGGYLWRGKNCAPPGPQTLWLGLQRARDLALAWLTFGPKTYV